MAGQTLTVAPGVDMSKALRKDGARLSKRWLREYLRHNPQKDFRNLSGGGSYVNGGDAVRMDLTLIVVRTESPETAVGIVNYQADPDSEWGYRAVVR